LAYLFLSSMGRFLEIAFRLIVPGGRVRMPLGRRLLALAAAPLFGLLQGLHWLGFLLDEVLFPGYRKVPIRRPVFVVGPPRSGTTFLHRVLAADARFATFSTWECLFAPSVTERKLWLGLARLDRAVGGPFTRLAGRLTRGLTGQLEAVHPVTLAAPEEDYLVFLQAAACFILVVGVPHADAVWRMGYFDRALSPRLKARLMTFYRRCLQKHLYVHGADRTLLSKNASFGPLVRSLLMAFPDARVVCTMRDPLQVVPSQLSAVRSGLKGLSRGDVAAFDARMIDVLRFHYRNLFAVLDARPPWQQVVVPMERTKDHLVETVSGIYRRLEIPMDPAFLAHLEAEAGPVRRHKSAHAYDLAGFGLSEATIRRRFRHAYRRYDFSAGALAGARERPVPAVAAS
jgi:hypothetical protein